MPKLFVDANVFLDFFREDMPNFHGLIASLRDLMPHILVTERIAAEVRRNKVRVAATALATLDTKLTFQSHRLPEHIDDSGAGHLHDFNGEIAKISAEVGDLRKRFSIHRSVLLRRIAHSEDKTSRILEELFSRAIYPSNEQLGRAKTRHLYGDPPGKRGGPLGDQISWEQFLDAVTTDDHLWIVTRDTDYFEDIGDGLVLNPVLGRELRQRMPTCPQPRIFSKLVDTIEDLRPFLPTAIRHSPSPAVADEIRKEEDSRSAHRADPDFADIAEAYREAVARKAPNESTLHYLTRGGQFSGYGSALTLAFEALHRRADEIVTSRSEKK